MSAATTAWLAFVGFWGLAGLAALYLAAVIRAWRRQGRAESWLPYIAAAAEAEQLDGQPGPFTDLYRRLKEESRDHG